MTVRVDEKPDVLHWFRADLRLQDNTAFSAAAARAARLGCLFVFDDALLASPRQGAPRVRFLRACVDALARELAARGQRLIVRRGRPREVVPTVARALGVDVVTWNRDPSGYAGVRDARVLRELEAIGVRGFGFKDRVVHDAADVHPCQDRSMPVFSPYRKAWWSRFASDPPRLPRPFELPPPFAASDGDRVPTERELGLGSDGVELPAAGERAGLIRLERFLSGPAARYREDRDYPARDGTSRLSPYLRFGLVSIRDCVRAGQAAIEAEPRARRGIEKWIDELIWREFYQAVLEDAPRLTRENHRPEFDDFEWNEDPEALAAWEAGCTGHPFVDAGIRELRATGHMHNRTRMVVASFLTKDLLIDWRRGEAFFMKWLVDGDPASNSGGWQWAASTGTDASDPLRIFNPILQGERFDPDGAYVRRFVPELAGLPGASVHRPFERPLAAGGYPAPIVDHAERRRIAIERFSRVLRDPSPKSSDARTT